MAVETFLVVSSFFVCRVRVVGGPWGIGVEGVVGETSCSCQAVSSFSVQDLVIGDRSVFSCELKK